MTDKKLTDSEIVKALSNITYGGHYCAKCKYDNGKGEDRCGLKGCKIARYALDLINRLQAQVKKCEKVEHFADKTIATLQAENERLRSPFVKMYEQFETKIKAEAYKEFAERVKAYLLLHHGEIYGVLLEGIDNLLKELVGEDNAEPKES